MLLLLLTPMPDDRLQMLVQRRFYGEASQKDTAELERMLRENPKLNARTHKIESDLRDNRVFTLAIKALVSDLDEAENEDFSAFLRTSERNRDLYQCLKIALQAQATARLQHGSSISEQPQDPSN